MPIWDGFNSLCEDFLNFLFIRASELGTFTFLLKR